MNEENVIQNEPIFTEQETAQNTEQVEQPTQQAEQQPAPDISEHIGTPETNDTYEYDRLNYERRVEAGEVQAPQVQEQAVQQTEEEVPDVQTFEPTANMSHQPNNPTDVYLKNTPVDQIEREVFAAIDSRFEIPKEPQMSDYEQTDAGVQQFIKDMSEYPILKNQAEQARNNSKEAFNNLMWNKVYEKYPALTKSPKTLETIQDLYYGGRARGKNQNPLQVADNFISEQARIRSAGRQSANTTKKIVQSAPLSGQSSARTHTTPTLPNNGLDAIADAGSDADALARILEQRRQM